MRGKALAMPQISLAHVLRGGELLLVAGIGLAAARLFWLLVTPLGPVGAWQPPAPIVPDAASTAALIDRFDPFGGQAAGTSDTTIATDLVLHGVRISGPQGGGAILELPDGTQASFAIGDEVLPDLRLVEVGAAHVLLERGGARQRLVMEGIDDSAVTAPIADSDAAQRLLASPPFTLHSQDGEIVGLSVTAADPALLASIGLQAGDVIVSVGNRRIGSADDLNSLMRQIRPGARITLAVDRGAEVIPVVLSL